MTENSKYTDAQMLYMLCLALEEGLEGIEHSEDLNVLLVKMIAEHWGTVDEDTDPDEVEAAFVQLESYIPEHLAPVPHGEPSDAQADAAQRGYHAFAFGPEEVDVFLTAERLAKGRDAWKAALRAALAVES